MAFTFLCSFSLLACASNANLTSFNWDGLQKEKIDLALPLLIVKGSKGFLDCGYINAKVCEKTNEACAIVSGVNTHDDMLTKKIKALSPLARSLGIKIGMSGKEAMELLR